MSSLNYRTRHYRNRRYVNANIRIIFIQGLLEQKNVKDIAIAANRNTSVTCRELQHNPDNHNTFDRWLIATAATYAVVHAA